MAGGGGGGGCSLCRRIRGPCARNREILAPEGGVGVRQHMGGSPTEPPPRDHSGGEGDGEGSACLWGAWGGAAWGRGAVPGRSGTACSPACVLELPY